MDQEERPEPTGAEDPGVSPAAQATGWQPRADYLEALVDMGISSSIAEKALIKTNNHSVDLAVDWVFKHQDDDQDDSEEDDITVLSSNAAAYKMVFVVNTALNMGVGKIAAQVAHGALGLYRELLEQQDQFGEMLLMWEETGGTKIVLRGEGGERELKELRDKALSSHLPSYIVRDAGKTQIAARFNNQYCE
ncbi:PREDICTED: probable peptidyl-tRNA hydrolase 2 [Priapulus caudatus]|uniref:peptidyl-tRNA hydrolase n=1 Tax=Priapulus caudatus TaxID=37621 RepID=A0ABM1EXG5_PRICU|nr:PREDICTED: probable peptidyl-tRNA hydrolase 2 [Priapulus caudatus]